MTSLLRNVQKLSSWLDIGIGSLKGSSVLFMYLQIHYLFSISYFSSVYKTYKCTYIV